MKEEQTKLVVQVQPNARQNEVLGFKQGVLYLRIAAPPARGKANNELINYLGDVLGIAKSCVVIQQGATNKRKLISIEGINQDRCMSIIAEWLDENKT